MSALSVCILWHMHQPNYRDPIRGVYSMPWVRLHATKAYYDMALMAKRHPDVGMTFNLVPSLLEQLEDYAAGAEDIELILSRRDPVRLTQEEKETILNRFFQADREHMVRPLPRYEELLHARGENGTPRDITTALRSFAAQDYLDLQVLFNLAWFGFSAREDQEIARLIHKGRRFTIEDRDLVLDRQLKIVGSVIGLYRELWDGGTVELSASPYYHPILPLLCDTSSALEGMDGCLLPRRPFRHSQDAATAVADSIAAFESWFGRRPEGMWPSEGSVNPQALEIIAEAGISWAATDETILARSVNKFDRARHLYKPWKAHGVDVFFRDHGLSDKIGFVYSRNPAGIAVDDFIGRLKQIAANGPSGRCVSIILDGENPWEYFPGSGREFLDLLYERLHAEPDLEPVSFSTYLEKHPAKSTVKSIFPGSWINGNFDTWIGDREEVDAWDALNDARDLLVAHTDDISEEDSAEAWNELYRAEGSDWFWWYGDDHSSPNDPEFDRLFRAHLERIYRIVGAEPPTAVTEPLLVKQVIRPDAEPTGLVTPVIDGRATTFYEWQAAGWLPSPGPSGAMSTGEVVFGSLYYGFDMDNVFLRLDFAEREEKEVPAGLKFEILLRSTDMYRVVADLSDPRTYMLYRRSHERWVRRFRRDAIAIDRVVELGVPFRDIGAKPGGSIQFHVALLEGGVERERWPQTGTISFVVPDEEYASRMWQI
jgi:alpha-amylase/alpha-mannosidase (GH57 family)